jgi:hypothetical protein
MKITISPFWAWPLALVSYISAHIITEMLFSNAEWMLFPCAVFAALSTLSLIKFDPRTAKGWNYWRPRLYIILWAQLALSVINVAGETGAGVPTANPLTAMLAFGDWIFSGANGWQWAGFGALSLTLASQAAVLFTLGWMSAAAKPQETSTS